MKNQSLPITLFCLALAGQTYAAKVIPNNAIANLVLGQPDFVTSASIGVYTSFNMSSTAAVAIDPLTGKVFVADEDGDRVLRYASLTSLTNGSGAEAVLGQSNFNDEGSSTTQQTMDNPNGLFVDHRGRLWVADQSNNRVLLFEAASYRSTFSFADRVFGQANFTTGTINGGGAVSASVMNNPRAVWVDLNDALWVADMGNNRVLRFDSISTKFSGSAANGVLGQALFTTNAAGAGSSGIQSPDGIAVSSGGELFVSCSAAHRILRFDNAATLGNGAGANIVLGQANFTNTTSGLSATTLNTPGGLEISASDELWVTDRNNSRILRYNHASTKATGAAADAVLGQANFVSGAAGNPASNRNLDPTGDDVTGGLSLDSSGALWAADDNHNRVLRFPPDITAPILTITSTVPKKTTAKSIVIKGTASDAFGVAKVQYKVGSGSVKTATGTTSWQFTASLVKGTTTILINATDAVGNVCGSKTIKIKRVNPTSAPQLLVSEN